MQETKKEVQNEVTVPESGSKISAFIGKCQECNEEHGKTCIAVQTVW